MQVGDKITALPQTLYFNLHDKSPKELRPMTGRVCYIHPRGRFFVLEFQFPGGVLIRKTFEGGVM